MKADNYMSWDATDWDAQQGVLFDDQPHSFAPPKGDANNRICVIDVGSNSVRMVVFEGASRCPAIVFNEKVLCGLGSQLVKTNALDPVGKERALRAMHRFAALAPALGVDAMVGVGTAAMREAHDGMALRDQIARETGIRLQIASGEDEARLAALGVLFGDPRAEGVVIDLGGASMEACRIQGGRIGLGRSVMLGPQHMVDVEDPDARMHEILEPMRYDFHLDGGRLYLVGGAWRALARIQMARRNYPLPVLHEFVIDPDEVPELAEWVKNADEEEIAAIPGVARARAANLPHAARLLEHLIPAFTPGEIMVSAFGLREGLCYENISERYRADDPLLASCAHYERLRAHRPGFGAELGAWILDGLGSQNAEEARLVRGVAMLADVCWRAHPDFRADICIEAVTRPSVSGAGHQGRIFMGAALLTRYKGGLKSVRREPMFEEGLDPAALERAVSVGLAMRLGCAISGAAPGILVHCLLQIGPEYVVLRPDRFVTHLMGEEVEKRLGQFARHLGLEAKIEEN